LGKAQNKKVLDSLAVVYRTATQDTSKIMALTAIANEYKVSKPDTCFQIAEKALAESEKTDFEKGKAWAILRIGEAHYNNSKPTDALAYYQKSLPIFEKIKDTEGLVDVFYNMGFAYAAQGNAPLALEYFQKGLKIADKKRQAGILNGIGIIYFNQKNYALSLEYFQKILKIEEEIGAKEKDIVYLLMNVGVCYYEQGNYDISLKYLQKSLKIYEQRGDGYGVPDVLLCLGELYIRQKQYPVALEYLEKSLKMVEGKEGLNEKSVALYCLNDMADIYQKQKNYDKSIEYAQKSLQIAQETKVLVEIGIVSKTLFEAYKGKGDYANALKYHELHKQTEDSLFSVNKTKALANLEAKAEIEKQQVEIEKQKEAKEFQQYISYLILAGFCSILIFAVFIYRSKQKEKQAKEKVQIQNQEILQKNEAIHQQKEELSQTLQVTESQRSEIQKKNEDITASINYALRIQNAIIPNEAELQKHFDCFVFFRPKDIVSGDFYWFADKGEKKILAVADCTGHGVSGAFMTMIGNNILNQIVHDYEIHEPDKILNLMSPLLAKTLLHSEGKVADGMDISIISIERNNISLRNVISKISYAGAMNPLYYVQSQEFVEIKADKRPIGGKIDEDFTYQKHEIRVQGLEDGELENSQTLYPFTLYLCSDGFQDQFGGEKDKKFMVSKFKKLLLGISKKPMTEQKQLLEQTFDDWKGEQKQTDDVLVVGIKI